MSKGQETEKGGKNKRKKREREKSEKKQERKKGKKAASQKEIFSKLKIKKEFDYNVQKG